MSFQIVNKRTRNGVDEARWGDSPWRIIDEETGLPEAGKDRFWRVSVSEHSSGGYLKVALLQRDPPRKKTWWGYQPKPTTSEVSVAHIDTRSEEFGEGSVLQTALYVLRNVGVVETREEKIQRLVGDYPPKSLKETVGGS